MACIVENNRYKCHIALIQTLWQLVIKMKLWIYLIFLLTMFASCSYLDSNKERVRKVEKFSKYVKDNKQEFEKLTKDILNDKYVQSRIGYFISKNELSQDLNERLTKLDIPKLSVSRMQCDSLELEYITAWTEYPVGQLYLTKDNCYGEQSNKGYYHQNNFIEVWGQGDGWVIWIDSDFI